MSDSELDIVYTRLCITMTPPGESQAAWLLARFAMPAMDRLGDAAMVQQRMDAVAEDMALVGSH